MAAAPDAAAGNPRPAFTYRRRVEFAETDGAGIVHFSMYFRYMEEAEHAMWRAAGLSIAPADADYGFPRVSASFDYHAPLRFEDELEVRIRIVQASSRSVRYTADIVRGETRIGTGTMTMVCVRARPGEPLRAIPFPDEIRAALGI